MSDIFTAKVREKVGSNQSRRLRKEDQTPAILYGLAGESVAIAIPTGEVNTAIRHGSHLIDLKGDLNEPALIKEVQWDALGSQVKHMDLERVDLTKDVEISVPLELHGVAPGVSNGGVVNLLIHEMQISCPAKSIPDHLEININNLEVDQELCLKDVELPAGASLLGEGEDVIVTCNVPQVREEEEGEAGEETAEPEVIGEKAGDENEGES